MGGSAVVQSSAERQALALAQRLRSMGIEVFWPAGATSAHGRLGLSERPFPTLQGAEQIREARYYTLGTSSLKLYAPSPFFELPPLDVSDCATRADVEEALRRAWASRIHELAKSRDWLEALGCAPRISRRGTRLRLPLTGMPGAGAMVASVREIQLPSDGPLEDRSPRTPAGRRMRPLPSIDCSSELELTIGVALERSAESSDVERTAAAEQSVLVPDEAPVRPVAVLPPRRRALLVAGASATLEGLERELRACEFEVAAFRDPLRALESLDQTSYDLVLTAAHLPRGDGLELAARVRAQAGVAELPVVVVDDRPNAALAEVAHRAGASLYLSLPLDRDTLSERLRSWGERRRWVRYGARLRVDTPARAERSEFSDSLSRGGLCLFTNRDLRAGEQELYRLALPGPLGAIEVEGVVTSRNPVAGSAAVRAGVRFVRFDADAESRWIRLIRALAAHERAARPHREPSARTSG